MADQNKTTSGGRAPQDRNAPTTGHVWDGIEEYNNPLPRWWLWTFYLTIIWAVGYMILYPAWPLVNSATQGILGYDTREEVQQEIARFEAANETWFQRLNETPLTEIAADEELQDFAVNAGGSIFSAQCSQCHGSGAAGLQASGYPNLLDDDWLWGGTIENIHQTVRYGIRNEEYDQARNSQMPAFGDILSEGEIDAVVHHVRDISGQEHDADLAAEGAEVYAAQCAACHGAEGGGNQSLGAPTLNDAIWLYGGDVETIRETVTNSRFGVMPGFADRLRDAEIRAVAAYVHQLGGGE